MQKNNDLRTMNADDLDNALMELELQMQKAYVSLNLLQQNFGFDEEQMTQEQLINIKQRANEIHVMFGIVSDYVYSSLQMLKGGNDNV